MKIVSCFSSLKELTPLAEAGADEFYTAVGDLPAFHSGTLPGPDLEPAVKKVRALGKKMALAVNSMLATATRRQLAAIERRVRALDALGVDAFIVSNPYLLDLFSGPGRRLRAQLHLSSVQPVFNSLSAAFFARFGISRLILPNQLSPDEARGILSFCRAEGIETEIFDYRFFGCVFVNGRCNLHTGIYHTFRRNTPEGALCRCGSGAELPVRPFDIDPARAAEAPAAARRVARRMGCGGAPRLYNAASFYDFFRLGAGWLKYGVRLDPPKVKERKVRALREMADLAETLTLDLGPAAGREEFIRRMTAWKGE
jgi:hypothetical protein